MSYHTHLYQSILYIHKLSIFHLCLLLPTFSFILHLHLHVSCHLMCLVSLFSDIKLKILRLIFLATSATHNSVYGSLILLQIPLYLLVSILKGKDAVSSLLKFLVLLETHFNGFTFDNYNEKTSLLKQIHSL